MPLHQCHTLQRGTTRRLVFVFAAEPGSSRPATNLDLSHARAAYIADGGQATPILVSVSAVGEWESGGLVEVDAELLPGVYQFGIPDTMLATDAAEAVLVIQLSGAIVDPVKFNLVAYDPQDAWSLGMTQLQDYKRHQVLRRALPRFTEMELALGRTKEEALAESLGEVPPRWAQED